MLIDKADYEALRARAERLRGVCEEVSHLYPELSEQEDWTWRLVHAFDILGPDDLADDLLPRNSYLRARGCAPSRPGSPSPEEAIRRMRDEVDDLRDRDAAGEGA